MRRLGSVAMSGSPVTKPASESPLALADGLAAITYDAAGLVPAIIQDDRTEAVLMLGYMSAESLELSLSQGRTVFWSRSRQELWRKGDTSGDHQYIRSVHYDCDGDTLLFRVEQVGGGACHTGEYSCFFTELPTNVVPAESSSVAGSDAQGGTNTAPTQNSTNEPRTS